MDGLKMEESGWFVESVKSDGNPSGLVLGINECDRWQWVTPEDGTRFARKVDAENVGKGLLQEHTRWIATEHIFS